MLLEGLLGLGTALLIILGAHLPDSGDSWRIVRTVVGGMVAVASFYAGKVCG